MDSPLSVGGILARQALIWGFCGLIAIDQCFCLMFLQIKMEDIQFKVIKKNLQKNQQILTYDELKPARV